MQRLIILPASLGETGLAELKQWLGITRTSEDALLTGLLGAAIDLCEAFTGQAPLRQTVEEQLPLQRGWQVLGSWPVQNFVGLELIGHDGGRSPLGAQSYAAEIAACGTAQVRFVEPLDGRAVAVRVVAGIAPDWQSLAPALRQGIIRLAAHHYRERDNETNRSPAAPPVSVTALWRPWRRMRLT